MKLSGKVALTALLVSTLATGKNIHACPVEPIEVNRVTLDGVTYINKGLVAFGLIPSDFRESTGDTLGGIGSAIALKPGSWKQGKDGQFSGTLYVHPDRGFNMCAHPCSIFFFLACLTIAVAIPLSTTKRVIMQSTLC